MEVMDLMTMIYLNSFANEKTFNTFKKLRRWVSTDILGKKEISKLNICYSYYISST